MMGRVSRLVVITTGGTIASSADEHGVQAAHHAAAPTWFPGWTSRSST